MTPAVSAIVAVHNGERFLAQALSSITSQSWSRGELEIVVVDDRCTDRSAEIARSCPGVRYLRNTVEGGVSRAYNLGLEAAQGELIAFLAHDDLWLPHKLERQVAYLEQHPQIGYCIAKARYFLEPGDELQPGMRERWLEGEHLARLPETLLARRAVFARVGGFDSGLKVASDVDWFARCADLGVPMGIVDEVLLLKRLHGGNLTGQVSRNTSELLALLRQSVSRKRAAGAGVSGC